MADKFLKTALMVGICFLVTIGLGEVTNVVPVPEQASMMLFGTGFISLAGLGRRKLVKN